MMTFDEYLQGISHLENGTPKTRKEEWSIPRTNFARQLWHDAIELNKAVEDGKENDSHS